MRAGSILRRRWTAGIRARAGAAGHDAGQRSALERLEPRRLLSNSQPVIEGGDDVAFSVPEHAAFIKTVVASDPDGDAVTLDLFGPDGPLFKIDPLTSA